MSADHGGHGHGSRFIQHHYDDAQHQFDSGKFGIWLFLAQEVLFFSALFVAYVLYRHHHPEIYDYAHKYLDVKYGAINTAVLIFSSLTAAWAVRAAQLGQRKLLIGCIFVTLLCALTFLGIKYIEYSHKYHEQILMGKYFDPCVASGGGPLVTKSNECPGHQGSVWNESKESGIGCYAEMAIDQEPDVAGLQLDCAVAVSKVTVERDPKSGDIIKDKSGAWKYSVAAGSPVPRCQHGSETFPCWVPSVQPAVCKPGFYYAVTCTPGAPCASEGKPLYQVSKRWNRQDDCEGDANQRGKDIKKAEEATKTASGWTVGNCTRSSGVGFVVERGGHDVLAKERTDGRVMSQQLAVATCKPPKPRPPAMSDVFADVERVQRLGQKNVANSKPEVDDHAAHDEFYKGPPPENTGMFFTIYFAMTGLHGIHVFAGVLVFIWLLIRAIKGHFTPDYFGPIDFAALYWHIVDLIWIFLFPLLYLIH